MHRPDEIRLLWEPRDLWCGVYWRRDRAQHHIIAFELYICLVPCLPIRLRWFKASYRAIAAKARADVQADEARGVRA